MASETSHNSTILRYWESFTEIVYNAAQYIRDLTASWPIWDEEGEELNNWTIVIGVLCILCLIVGVLSKIIGRVIGLCLFFLGLFVLLAYRMQIKGSNNLTS